ncbi:MAG: nitroreductase family protein [Bacteroidetes bacterium]|nr:nitroreductase family protein [Bacteroidota bacterium]
MEIAINHDSCINCGRCIKICPSEIFEFTEDKKAVVVARRIKNCIVCGHCVGVCPTNSITHSSFPAEKVHKIDFSQIPTAEQMMMLCKARRSNRAFSDKEVPQEFLDTIIEAGHRAPTASNLQQVRFTLVTDPEKIKLISDYTLSVFAPLIKALDSLWGKIFVKPFAKSLYRYIPVFKKMKRENAKGNDMILRGAKAVIIIHASKVTKFGCQDCNLAYQNASLMAECLGVSQFYGGFVCSAIKQDKQNRLNKILGIKTEIHAVMALGMPQFKFVNYIDKKDAIITKL